MPNGMQGLLSDPRMGLLAGLLQGGAPGGTLGGGLSSGLQQMQQMQRGKQQGQLLQAQMGEMEAKKRQREAQIAAKQRMATQLPSLIGQPAIAPTFQGEGPLLPQEATGLYETRPELAGLLSTMAEADPMGAAKVYGGLLTEKKPDQYMTVGDRVFDKEAAKFLDLPAGPKDKEEAFKQEEKLRKAFTDVTKDFAGQNDSYGRVLASVQDPSPAGDLALIFNYMKILDPGSTVREGEFANAENSAGIPERLRAQYNKVTTGERLSETMRNDFTSRAGMLYGEAVKGYKHRESTYQNLAKQYELDPSRVTYERQLYDPALGLTPQAPVTTPPPAMPPISPQTGRPAGFDMLIP